MKDKIAEEILNKMVDGFVPYFSESEVIEAMQAYHEAKMKEVTDEDIKAWANSKEKIIDEICELMQAYFKAKLRESKIIESFERENNG